MNPAPRLQTLAEIEAALWRELARAPLDRHHEWRTPVLATVDTSLDAPAADARTVVLRETDREACELRLFTDARSTKVAQIDRHPQGTLLLWSKRLSWQLRLRVTLHVQTDGLAVASRWAKLRLSPAAQDYLAPLAPGSPMGDSVSDLVSNPMTDPPDTPVPDRASRPAVERAHFALVCARVDRIDWLELDARGHRRAVFEGGKGRWVTP